MNTRIRIEFEGGKIIDEDFGRWLYKEKIDMLVKSENLTPGDLGVITGMVFLGYKKAKRLSIITVVREGHFCRVEKEVVFYKER